MTTSSPGQSGPLRETVAPSPLTPALVVRLQARAVYPAISVLATTRPGPAMHREDATTVHRLVNAAAERLRAANTPKEVASCLVSALRSLADTATQQETDAAMALFVDARTRAWVRLPLPVTDRVVIDPTFATRDLVLALHRTPRHLVLALSTHQARLFAGVGKGLEPVHQDGFPIVEGSDPRADGRRSDRGWRGRGRGRGQSDRADPAAGRSRGPDPGFLRRVDAALSAHLRSHPAPLILVGQARTISAFTALSRNTDRLAGTLTSNLLTAPLASITPRVRLLLTEYLRSREQEALALLERRTGQDRSVSGVGGAWLAARTERPEMLAVEVGFSYPARLGGDGDYPVHAVDTEHPDVIDDLVDDLIETVLHRGGWVALVSDGTLAAHGRVALTLYS